MDNGILTVSQINKYLYLKVNSDANLKSKLIKGEISNFKYHEKTGCIFFTLKDSESSIKAIMYRSAAEKLKAKIEDGMSVVVVASVTLYERDGNCQLSVMDIQPIGEGKINAEFERLKKKLYDEGLCDEERKRPLPEFPKKIGLITARGSAAEKDVISTLERRYPIGEIVVFPVLVQGENAPLSIKEAIISASKSDCDVLILARGGGSNEDLSCFNTEIVARAVAESSIPMITAVGHEIDTTLVDYVSDKRAATPTAAAELVAPDKKRLLDILQNYMNMLYNYTLENISSCERKYSNISNNFALLGIDKKLTINEEKLELSGYKLSRLTYDKINHLASLLETKEAELKQLNPMLILSRGYSVVTKDAKIVSSTDNLSIGDTVEVELGRGKFVAKITEIGE
ncbi:MAG: exodeoxyribonuclease VII large subunit [Oscillospiraceae bacterium]|nr:exodeoxyribonuclease VII large subunit [Oscillospiraceae bacterium]